MTLPVAGLQTWEGALWRRLAGVRRPAITSAWLPELAGRTATLPVLPSWDALERSLPVAAAPEEATTQRSAARSFVRADGSHPVTMARTTSESSLAGLRRPPDAASMVAEGGSVHLQSEQRNVAGRLLLARPPVEAVRELLRRALVPSSNSGPVASGQPVVRAVPPASRVSVPVAAKSRPPESVRTEFRSVLERRLVNLLRHHIPVVAADSSIGGEAVHWILESAIDCTLPGEQAPPDLLVWPTAASPARREAHSSAGSPETPAVALDPPRKVAIATSAEALSRHLRANAQTDSESEVPPRLADERPLHPMGLSSRSSMPAPDVPVSVVRTGAGSVSRVFPPQATPSMPPLIPEKVVQPPAYGLAGPVTRVMTRPEDLPEHPDDLGVLAAKIKLILLEEARRHGISV